ncbi:riboflavin synthase [Candidatus Planktophila versatilis]|uniref:Riboflavin synthase n=1 Tax=Candidatus Planktophila versatilis TaxID=1884905 RepID=A0AAC9YV64_9ACTN|nr:riboflavin synthase [Candidatus Planktophila versatilis]ASY22402.1 riboflavin synthase [Candidatus Planktophila versatilis]
MFTGLITELGTVQGITRGESSAVFTITAPQSVAGLGLGDSIAVNGVCLTASSITGDSFTADVMVQTLKLTSLSELEVGSPVNLELAAKLDMRMGGHIVQGHVDGVATVVALTPGEKWAQLDLTVPAALMKYVVAQGSITLDGVSLTVGALDDATNSVSVWLIPETLAKTNLSAKKAGGLVNVEVDVLAKYVERLLKKGVAGGN